ncbi:hypothetical protein [Methylotenera sp.]|uniref:hypothetical protein n=1 Tax=Methylotenera sp. TaxID=2051956 RepID=UPI002487409F|nr:hypothetical protein [Methylotenera sp.]MDI1361746.1 hypothetical protein [Methylotenera sp.]
MTKSKTSIIQIRIEPELIERYQKYAQSEGFHLSVALRRDMKLRCEQYEAFLLRQEVELQRRLNAK